jgi:hypothetical protein
VNDVDDIEVSGIKPEKDDGVRDRHAAKFGFVVASNAVDRR